MKLNKPRVIGWALALLTVFIVEMNEQDIGIARDEVVYMSVAPNYANWWLGLANPPTHTITKKGIDQVFGGAMAGGNNPEHPPLVKTLMGISHKLLYDKLGICDELTAFRLPNALFAGLLVWLVYSMTLALWGFAEAVLAALCTLLLPRALFHAGI